MSIYDKIEQIRQKPEHIRVRYVWICVAISMVFVLGIWVLSLNGRQYQAGTSGQVAGQASIFDDLKKQKDNISQYQQEMSNIKGNLQQGLQDAQSQQTATDQQNITDQPVPTNKEGFSGGGNLQNTKPATNPADLLQ